MPVDDRHAAHGGHGTLGREVPVAVVDDAATAEHKAWLKEMRGWLIVLATLAASVTYQAGLNPPGGFWQDDNRRHTAGNPVLHDRVLKRYLTFYYFNATAFATSLVIIILLLNERFYKSEAKVAALTLTTMVDLMSLVGAYIAGSTRDMPSSIYIIVLTCFLFVCVVYFSRVLPNLCFVVLFMVPGLFRVAKKGWLPVTDNLKNRVESAKKREEDEKEAEKKGRKNNGCSCCPCGRAFKYNEENAA
jgi:hypothetical protein